MDKLFIGIAVGFCVASAVFTATGYSKWGINYQCQKGWTWKTIDYVYHCTAEARP